MGPIPLAMLIAHHLAERRHWFACIHAQNERQPPCPRLNTSRPYRSSHARRTTETWALADGCTRGERLDCARWEL